MFPLWQRADGGVYNGGVHPDQLMGGADYYSQLGLDPTYGEYLEVSARHFSSSYHTLSSLDNQHSIHSTCLDGHLYHVLNGARILWIVSLLCAGGHP